MSTPLPPEDRERLETLFERAAELPQAERAAFAERECGAGQALRAELERLLAGLDAEDVLGRSRPDAPTRVGTRIDRYKLLERIGEGGMGEVYAAEQLEPVQRRVALKLIKPGMDSAQVVARFEAERQALARMAHPNVAQVYDGGTAGDGRPYFVMEYVAGESITEYCDRRKLATAERLELFLGLCDGVQHAHQKGLIHRDLKPSNLLVMQQDGRAVPKVIDFGVARATTGSLAGRTLHTMLGQIVGTLDYMSPEQADPTGTDIDTRSDVYSLGVVLYQLLSGLLPFDHRSQTDLALSDVVRTIREQDPPTPSTRLRRTGTGTAVAPLHGTDPRTLQRQLTGDLDWICLKALEKDPARRYASASELAADLRRHLADLPVLAGRPGALYRARKYVRRHRLGVTAGLLLAAAVSAGVVGTVSARIKALSSARLAEALRPQADVYRLRQLVQQADELWPPHPERIPALEAWISDASELEAPLPGHRTKLEALRGRARPRTEAERARDRATHPRAEVLANRKAELEAWIRGIERGLKGRPPEPALARVAVLEREIADLEFEVEARRTWFESDQDQARFEMLSGLVEGLEELQDDATGLASERPDALSPEHGWSVPRRLAFARQLEAGFAEGGDYARAWSDALPRIRAAYPGLDLQPQMGLVPIGPDPASGLWEFAHLMTGAPARRAADGRLVLTQATEDTGVVLVLLPAGTFWMGSQPGDPGGHNHDPALRSAATRPVHEVRLSAHFLSKFEMTQGQWKYLTGGTPSAFGPEPSEWDLQWLESGAPVSLLHPVEQVSWLDCREWLPRAGLSLPSEAQWEHGARAGTSTPFWTGEEVSSLQGLANLSDGYAAGHGGQGALDQPEHDLWDGSTRHWAVGSGSRGNPFGLYDVTGNLMEWCLDGYDPDFYIKTQRIDPVAPWNGDDPRICRGGLWRTGPRDARSAARSYYPPSFSGHGLGVRPARAVTD